VCLPVACCLLSVSLVLRAADYEHKKSPDGLLQYTLPIWIFIGCATAALVTTLVLLLADRARGGKLNASASDRAARLAAEEADAEARNQAAYGRDATSQSPGQAPLTHDGGNMKSSVNSTY